LPKNKISLIPKSIDFIGNIAVVEVPKELWEHRFLIGQAILMAHKHVSSVFAKASSVEGEFRLRKFEHIGGKYITETIHKEYGCLFKLDVEKVYFSPRLSFEHWRVANLIRDSEVVFDMFTGVGPFAILAAKLKNIEIYAVDINPYCIKYLKENMRLNKLKGKIYPILDDARKIAVKLRGMVDRVIMNHPTQAMKFLDKACISIKPEGGIIHFYTFAQTNKINEILKSVKKKITESGRHLDKILLKRKIREIAPYKWQIVLDILLQ